MIHQNAPNNQTKPPFCSEFIQIKKKLTETKHKLVKIGLKTTSTEARFSLSAAQLMSGPVQRILRLQELRRMAERQEACLK